MNTSLESPPTAVDLIQAQMDALGMKQKELVRQTGIRQSTMSLHLSGKRNSSRTFLESCADVLDLDVESLVKAQALYDKWASTLEGKQVLARDRLFSTTEFYSTSILADWQIDLHMKAGDISVTPASGVNLEKASMDLNRGECYLFDKNKIVNLGSSLLILEPGQTARVHALEKLKLPTFLVGKAGGMSFHVRHGIAVNFGLQFDPGYEGHPFALMTHHGIEPFELRHGEPFLSVDFSYVVNEDPHNP